MQKRKHTRKPVAFASEILFDGRDVPCKIINISVGGAKLKIEQERENNYPQAAVLDISPFGRFTITVIWQSGEHMGVKFHDTPDKMAEVLIAMAVY